MEFKDIVATKPGYFDQLEVYYQDKIYPCKKTNDEVLDQIDRVFGLTLLDESDLKVRKLDTYHDVKQAIAACNHLYIYELNLSSASKKYYKYHEERFSKEYPILIFYSREEDYLDSNCPLIQFEIKIMQGIDKSDIDSRSSGFKNYLNSMYLLDDMRCKIELKVIVFDLGGTLMRYVGMPFSWADFYHEGFEEIIRKYQCHVSQRTVENSVQMLKDINPRLHYREIEYSAESIFTKVLEPWHLDVPVQSCIETFWSGLKLEAEIYPETIPVLQKLREKGWAIAALTDLPSAMPDELFRRNISGLLEYFDYYVSSAVSGYRKPNGRGLQMISERFATPIQELIFVGDEEKDRETAIRAGCQFILIDRNDKQEDSVTDLSELLTLLDENVLCEERKRWTES